MPSKDSINWQLKAHLEQLAQSVGQMVSNVESFTKAMEASGRPKRLLSIDEAAAYLGIRPQTLRNRLARKAKDPFPVKPKRIGRKPLFDLHDLDRYIDGLPGGLSKNGGE